MMTPGRPNPPSLGLLFQSHHGDCKKILFFRSANPPALSPQSLGEGHQQRAPVKEPIFVVFDDTRRRRVACHCDNNSGTAMAISFDVGDAPSTAYLHIGGRRFPTGTAVTADFTTAHRVSRETARNATRVSVALYVKRTVARQLGRLGGVGAAVAKASTRAARPEWQRVAVLLDGAHKRVRPHWYSGTIVDYAAAMNEYTVRFDDGEQMSLDLRTQAALVHYTRSRMRKA